MESPSRAKSSTVSVHSSCWLSTSRGLTGGDSLKVRTAMWWSVETSGRGSRSKMNWVGRSRWACCSVGHRPLRGYVTCPSTNGCPTSSPFCITSTGRSTCPYAGSPTTSSWATCIARSSCSTSRTKHSCSSKRREWKCASGSRRRRSKQGSCCQRCEKSGTTEDSSNRSRRSRSLSTRPAFWDRCWVQQSRKTRVQLHPRPTVSLCPKAWNLLVSN
mmetsp:Transcript_1985/g.5494  ORF Transcript_1985/g.5494 Transcript_1985/m.5494 type:complete len:216 (-) Transcript_1985:555-1202(-)